jgi:hypothetical protein
MSAIVLLLGRAASAAPSEEIGGAGQPAPFDLALAGGTTRHDSGMRFPNTKGLSFDAASAALTVDRHARVGRSWLTGG